MTSIRVETKDDITAIHTLNTAAFDGDGEARLVDALRAADALTHSLVAVDNDAVVAYLAISPVTITDGSKVFHALGLGPVAVSPSRQNQGIGSMIIRYWLDHLAQASDGLVVVLGHADYYPRFGFKPSRPFGICWEHDVPEDVFMVLELRPGVLDEVTGVVRYHEAFSHV